MRGSAVSQFIYQAWMKHWVPHKSILRGVLNIEAETKWPPFPDDVFQRIFFDENVWISFKISLKFVPRCPIDKLPALIMACRRPGDKTLSEPMIVICYFTDAYVRHSVPMGSQIARFMGPTWAHLGPVGPRWAPCWPHGPCYQGLYGMASIVRSWVRLKFV